MTGMQDIFGPGWTAAYQECIRDGLVTERYHPDYEQLAILNYTPQTAYAKAWDEYTLAARGLIYDRSNGRVLARPFAKFFNYGQSEVESTTGVKLTLDTEVMVANKYDGSLGIVYMTPDNRLAVATRGSFASEQAKHATERLLAGDQDSIDDYIWYADEIEDGWTPLVEIIYPENRIVLNYGEKDYLQYLGSIRNSSGAFFPHEYESLTVGEVLERAPRPNAEGFVAWIDRHTAVKFKQEDYVRLHAIVTNLSEKAVWEVAKDESEIDWRAFVRVLPDELQPWAESIRDDLQHAVFDTERFLLRWYDECIDIAWDEAGHPDETPRAVFASVVNRRIEPQWRGYMYSILDGKNYIPKIWAMYKPEGLGMRPTGSEAAALG